VGLPLFLKEPYGSRKNYKASSREHHAEYDW